MCFCETLLHTSWLIGVMAAACIYMYCCNKLVLYQVHSQVWYQVHSQGCSVLWLIGQSMKKGHTCSPTSFVLYGRLSVAV